MSQFRETDAEVLLQILELANQRFLRQSRVHQKSSFNILRMLSAYKQICDSFPSRKQQVYNWIIYITKNYNPQTMKTWQNAIKDLSSGCRKFQSHGQTRINVLNSHALSMNKTTNEFCNQIDQDSIINNQFDIHNRSQFIPRRISRQIKNVRKQAEYFSRDNSQANIMAPISSKIQHYISFQPEQNKQNINSGNTKSQNLQSEQLRFDNHPTRTPGERSFIYNLPLSYGSPFVMSKITNNTKDVTQIEQQELLTPVQANMRARADLFHDINLKFKAFSAVLANFQAFQMFQLIISKTRLFQKVMYFNRFIQSGTQYKNGKDKKKQYFKTAFEFYELNLIKKSFKVLNVLSKLKIENKNKKKIQVRNFNYYNFEFLTSLIFNPLSEQKQFGQYSDTPKSIRHKSKYFQNIQDCEKMEMISEYFSNNLRINKQQIQNIFQMVRKVKKQQTFTILKNNVRKFMDQNNKVMILRRKKTLDDFMKVSYKIFSSKARVNVMRANSDRKTKQKIFKALFQFSLSKKVYYKREQFLSQTHKQKMMKQILQKWKSRRQQIRLRKLGFEVCVQQGLGKIQIALTKNIFRIISKTSQQIKARQLELEKEKKLQTCKGVFNFLKKRVVWRKIYLEIRQKLNRSYKKNIMVIWSKLTKATQFTEKIRNLFERNSFGVVKKQYQQIKKRSKLEQNVKLISLHRGLKQLRISYNLDKQQYENNIKKVEQVILIQNLCRFNKICKFQVKVKKMQQAKDLRLKKTSFLIQFIVENTKKTTLTNLVSHCKQQSFHKNKLSIISSVMGQRAISIQKQKGSQESQKLGQTYTKNHQSLKKQAIDIMKQNFQLQNKSIMLKSSLNTKTKQFTCQKFRQWRRYNENKNKIQIAQNKKMRKLQQLIYGHFKKQHEGWKSKEQRAVCKRIQHLKFTTLLSLANQLIDIESKVKQLSKIVNMNRKTSMGKRLFYLFRKRGQFENKRQRVSKFSFIRYFASSFCQKNNLDTKTSALISQIKKNYLKKFGVFQKQMRKNRLISSLEQKKIKRFAVMKVNRAVFRHILAKKQLCMAIKFKAIQLCKISFKALLANRWMETRQTLAYSKKFRLHEHISTSYTSI